MDIKYGKANYSIGFDFIGQIPAKNVSILLCIGTFQCCGWTACPLSQQSFLF